MAVFRTKWDASPETLDFAASDANEALNGLARETGVLMGLARVSSVTAGNPENVVPLLDPSSGRAVWQRNHVVAPQAVGAVLLGRGIAPMSR
jgi:hypothetical protein